MRWYISLKPIGSALRMDRFLNILRILFFSLTGLLVVFLIVSRFFWPTGPGVQVIIINDGHSPLLKLKLQYTGGEKMLGDCPPGQTQNALVNPGGDSDLIVIYGDADSTEHKERVNQYMERGSVGTITIWIEGPNKLRWKGDVRRGPYEWF